MTDNLNPLIKFNQRHLWHIVLLLCRLWLGLVMIKHSSVYLFEDKMADLIDFLTMKGFPLPLTMAYLSQVVEFIASLLVLIGIRVGAFLLVLTMGVAVVFAHDLLIFGEGELAFNYFMFALLLTLAGMGKYSIDHVILQRVTR